MDRRRPADPPRRVLVVGAVRGIGLAVAQRFAADGHDVTGTWHHTEPPPAGPGRPELRWVRCDITAADDVTRLFADAAEAGAPYEVVVANAAVLRDRLSSRMTDEDFQAVVDVDLTGTFRVAREALRTMTTRRWGRLVLIGSIGATWGNAGQANYAAAKAGLSGMARALAREVGRRNVTVNVVAPGAIATELIAGMDERLQDRWVGMVPADRMGRPAEVAAAVAYLASERAGLVTGATVPVDGGAVA